MLKKCKEAIKSETDGYVSCQLMTYARQNVTISESMDFDYNPNQNEVEGLEASGENEEICETIVSFDHVLVTLSGTIYYII